MERYFPKIAKTSTSKKTRYHPYSQQSPLTPKEKEGSMFGRSKSRKHRHSDYEVQAISFKPTIRELNRGLLCSLKNEDNPITHSDIGKRTYG